MAVPGQQVFMDIHYSECARKQSYRIHICLLYVCIPTYLQVASKRLRPSAANTLEYNA